MKKLGWVERRDKMETVFPELVAACKARIDEWHSNDKNFYRAEPESLKMMRKALARVEGI